MILDAFDQRIMLFGHLFVAPLSLEEASYNSDLLYTSFHGPDLSEVVMDDLVILCKLVVCLARNRWWMNIDGLL